MAVALYKGRDFGESEMILVRIIAFFVFILGLSVLTVHFAHATSGQTLNTKKLELAQKLCQVLDVDGRVTDSCGAIAQKHAYKDSTIVDITIEICGTELTYSRVIDLDLRNSCYREALKVLWKKPAHREFAKSAYACALPTFIADEPQNRDQLSREYVKRTELSCIEDKFIKQGTELQSFGHDTHNTRVTATHQKDLPEESIFYCDDPRAELEPTCAMRPEPIEPVVIEVK